jgi:hypothetical protein
VVSLENSFFVIGMRSVFLSRLAAASVREEVAREGPSCLSSSEVLLSHMFWGDISFLILGAKSEGVVVVIIGGTKSFRLLSRLVL